MLSRHALIRPALVLAMFLGTIPYARAQTSLDSMLSPYLSKYELPALAAAVMQDGKLIAVGAVGTRKAGQNLPVTVNDRFHLGSDTKAMTSLLAAILVDTGKLRWNSTVAEVLPGLAAEMDAGLKSVTLEQLLSHSSGIPADNAFIIDLVENASKLEGNLDEQRYTLVKKYARQPLEAKPGTKFTYANMNYLIAGVMIERVAGKSWEELIMERLFNPLGLKTAGLGAQASLGKIDAPLGHAIEGGRMKAFLAGPNGDNPSVVGPAGTAHMSVLDFATWAGWNAGQGKRGPKLVSTETQMKLYTPVINALAPKNPAPGTPTAGRYCLGWGEVVVDWAPRKLLQHAGSNGKNLAHIWLDPQNDLAIVILTNMGGNKAEDALQALAIELYLKHTRGQSASFSNPR